jgi:hypothetical protein
MHGGLDERHGGLVVAGTVKLIVVPPLSDARPEYRLPPKFTVLSVLVKPVPWMSTLDSTGPETGVRDVIDRVEVWPLVTVKDTAFEVPFVFLTVTAYSPAGMITP